MINSMNILLTSYGFVINLFPASQQLQEKSYKNVMSSVVLALGFCFASYMILTLLVVNVYGVENIQQNLFDNLTGESNMLSIGIRVIFMIIFLNNIPFVLPRQTVRAQRNDGVPFQLLFQGSLIKSWNRISL